MILLGHSHKQRKAFTLIELLIVLIIIAILVAVSWVFYSEYAASAKIRCSKENHKTMINYTSEVVTLCKLTSTVSLLDKNGNEFGRIMGEFDFSEKNFLNLLKNKANL